MGKDGKEFIIEVNDSALTLLGDSQEEDRRHIADLVAGRMQAICRPKTPPGGEEPPPPPPVGPRGILGSLSSLTHSETPPPTASEHPSLSNIGRRDSQGKPEKLRKNLNFVRLNDSKIVPNIFYFLVKIRTVNNTESVYAFKE